MRDVAVVAFAQSQHSTRDADSTEVEILAPVIADAVAQAGVARQSIGFTCSGSCDYLVGAPFSFVSALDAVGAWPPISESHVEMDAAWALYEAWVRLQHDDGTDTALVYGFGKASNVDVAEMLALQLDPYYLAPLWPDQVSLAALQARAYIEARGVDGGELAAVGSAAREAGAANPNAVPYGSATYPDPVEPLRPGDVAPVTDGAAAIILAAGDAVRACTDDPAWIRGIAHRIEAHSVGARDLTRSRSTEQAAAAAGLGQTPVDIAEVHAQFGHEQLILRDALGLGPDVRINPSGGPLAANPVMATGLIRIGEAAARVRDGSARRAVAHATSGPCLQQNLVCVLEGE
ncbi:MAG TPA: lipid-transfer protein [Streptosporangiaceae bacterium]|jgi:acetyl-CoA acetyltransferase